jgi:hypothetical protein
MKRFIFAFAVFRESKNCVIYNVNENLNDGGQSRNRAFLSYFRERNFVLFNSWSEWVVIRVIKAVCFTSMMLFAKEGKVVIHQNALIILFPPFLLKYKIFCSLYRYCLKKFDSRNDLVFEVNDLIYEQYIDLFDIQNDVYLYYQKTLFGLVNANFVFASNSALDYACLKYGVKRINSSVVLNGSEIYSNNDCSYTRVLKSSNNIRCLYAGSLNKGRQIESLIDVFSGIQGVDLYLCGPYGEWLNSKIDSKNVTYLGELSERDAFNIARECDFGLIPYDSNRWYYNVCYPTKIAFYLCAGIPVLSTKLLELEFHFADSKYVFFDDLDNWPVILLSMREDVLGQTKNEVVKIRDNFSWSVILKEWGYA